MIILRPLQKILRLGCHFDFVMKIASIPIRLASSWQDTNQKPLDYRIG